jgi:GT2 family glycosyltransferase
MGLPEADHSPGTSTLRSRSVGSPQVIIAGMHRSGTSLAASLMHALGYGMGPTQLPADRANPRGYFEDVDFLDLNRRMLVAATIADDGGHRDWGWTETERLDRAIFSRFEAEAQKLVEARRALGTAWGWKDPRTSVLLDFWDALVPEARYLFLYRLPWEVADSIQRLGAEVFLRRPDYAYRIWAAYNRELLAFRRRHPGRSLLVSANALVCDPNRLRGLLQARLGLAASDQELSPLIDDGLFRSAGGRDPLAALVAAVHPACGALLAELEADADLPAGDVQPLPPLQAPATAEAPAVSVIVPCFEQGEFLIEAVASVERSVQAPYELIIVNDGSRDLRTCEILKKLKSAGYCVLDQENQGVAGARNAGLAAARADAVLPLDADNRLCPGFVEPGLAALARDPGIAVVYGDRLQFGLRSGPAEVGDFDADRLVCANYIDACALIRAAVARDSGGYDRHMPSPGWEDWDLWLSIVGRGWRMQYLPGAPFEYRVRPGSMIAALDDPDAHYRNRHYLVSKHSFLLLSRVQALLNATHEAATKLNDAREEIVVANAQLAETRSALTTARDETEQVRADAWKVQQDLEKTTSELSTFSERCQALSDQLEAKQAETECLHAELALLVSEHQKLSASLAASHGAINAITNTLTWRARGKLLKIPGLAGLIALRRR